MKVYVIHPKTPPTLESLSEGLGWWGVEADRAPRELALMAALAPDGVELVLADQHADDPIDFEALVDVVVLLATPEQVPGLRYLAGRFRARRIPVVLAGSYVSTFPDRADFVDVRLVGDLEQVWPAFLRDRLAGVSSKKQYRAEGPVDLAHAPIPRWDLLTLSKYRQAVIEVARADGHGAARARYRPVEKVLEELELLAAHDVGRIWLEAPDLFADREQARHLLEALSDANARRHPRIRFETRLTIASVRDAGLTEALSRANVRRVELELDAETLESPLHHEDPREAIEAVRRLHEQGVRVAGRLTLFRDGDDDQSIDAQLAVARESHAIPWPRSARALPGTGLYERLRQAGRIVVGGRDAELRIDLFETPNFTPEHGARDTQAERLRSLVLERFAPLAIDMRLAGFFREAARAPAGDMWPAREDLRALGRMLGGTFQNKGEDRVRLTLRAVSTVLTCRPPMALWAQGLEQLLEEAATRSFVVKTAQGRPLEAALPEMSWKQRAVGMGAKLVGMAASRKM